MPWVGGQLSFWRFTDDFTPTEEHMKQAVVENLTFYGRDLLAKYLDWTTIDACSGALAMGILSTESFWTLKSLDA